MVLMIAFRSTYPTKPVSASIDRTPRIGYWESRYWPLIPSRNREYAHDGDDVRGTQGVY